MASSPTIDRGGFFFFFLLSFLSFFPVHLLTLISSPHIAAVSFSSLVEYKMRRFLCIIHFETNCVACVTHLCNDAFAFSVYMLHKNGDTRRD